VTALRMQWHRPDCWGSVKKQCPEHGLQRPRETGAFFLAPQLLDWAVLCWLPNRRYPCQTIGMAEGIGYVLINPAMPGMVKIGRTSRAMEARLGELYSTGVPLPFECAYAGRVGDEGKVERAFHQAFGPYRVNPKREFFSIEPEQAIALLELMALEDVTPAVQKEAEQVDTDARDAAERFKKARRPRLNFLELGVPIGSTLKFTDGPQACTVVDQYRVEYEGEPWTMMRLAQTWLGIDRRIRGSTFFTFNGRRLSDIYNELYSDEA